MPDAQIRIRLATPADEPALSRLDHDTWSYVHAVAPRPGPDEPFYRDHAGPGDHLVAELDGRLVGYLRLGFATPLASNVHVRQIRGLAVDEAARGKGVGRALIRAALERARALGARRVTLHVLAHNAAARALYAAEGFTVEGVLPEEFLLDGEYVDDVLMGQALV